MTTNQLAYIYALGAVLLWSTVASAFKIALSYFTPLQLVLVAVTTSIIALVIILLIQGKMHLVGRQFKQKPKFYLVTGLLNPFLYYFVLFEAYDLLPAQQALSLNYTWAILLPLLAVPILKHKLMTTDVISALVGYCGVFVIATKGQITDFELQSPLGVALALTSTLVWCSYWMVNAKDKGDAIVSLLLSFLVGLPIVLFTLLLTQELPTLSLKGLAAGMYVGLFEMGVTFVLWLMALKHTDKTANVSTMAFLTPMLSVGFIAFILDEPIETATFFGLAMIISGLIIQQLGGKIAAKRNQ
ncbi:DMT family transporter [Shewanella maritima]|uniref:DMT family transporter n=1 Tax=Shewanella maritima TaxID=2520507 RepID=A0A411PF46_9GAMM|nr:DMT family transporter [Shewanella maritima]QBF82226.1 DMT family transporter [Shewanella maritima]